LANRNPKTGEEPLKTLGGKSLKRGKKEEKRGKSLKTLGDTLKP
jgi:hypothetical protein